MPLRVGIDMASVDEVRKSVDAHAERYLQRVYTEGEVRDSRTADAVDPQRLAARFAAKEATMKVLRPGDRGFAWRSIAVRRASSGNVELDLTGDAARAAEAAGIISLAVSLTHEHALAAAVVVAETNAEEAR